MQSIRSIITDLDHVVENWRLTYFEIAPEGRQNPSFDPDIVELLLVAISRPRPASTRYDLDVERLVEATSGAVPSIAVVSALLSALGDAVVTQLDGPPKATGDEYRQRIFVVVTGAISFAASRVAKILHSEANHDDLTGIYNRRAFNAHLLGYLEKESDFNTVQHAAIDLDGLKAVNDTMGHEAGDRLIRDLATALGKGLWQESSTYRWGGDEFAVLAPGRSAQELESMLTRIRDEFEIPFSFGVAEYPKEAETAIELTDLADSRMFTQKGQRKSKLRRLARWISMYASKIRVASTGDK